MLSDHSPIEAHFTAHRAPRGGVAPSRHDVALHAYVDKQRRRAQATPATGAISALLAGIAAVRTMLMAGNHALKSKHAADLR